MFKIISKKRYEELCAENKRLNELRERTNRKCDKWFCSNCVHAINVFSPLAMETEVYCDLDRTCENYERIKDGTN